MNTITVNPDKIIGKIKELNGVGGGPVTNHFVYDATEDFIEANIPYCRTHDIEYPFGSGEFVDIHCIFKNFNADENDPENYNFTMTDEYFKCIQNANAKVFYRLGATIEHQPVKLHIFPPKDFAKYGRICSKIISHYNEGWANGFYMGIEYFEFWNEPDIPPCWQGTDEQFAEFYDTVARIIKKDHPNIKFGGSAFADINSPVVSKLLAHIKENNTPFDFFSYHQYFSSPVKFKKLTKDADELLKKYGFENTEIIFDEWNYVKSGENLFKAFDFHKTSYEAAFMTAVLCVAQNSSIDKAMYYDVQMLMVSSWNGVFKISEEDKKVYKQLGRKVDRLPGYYVLKSFGDLRKLSNQIEVQASSEQNNIFAVGAKDDSGKIGVLVSYVNDDVCFDENKKHTKATFKINAPNGATAFIIDENRTFEETKINNGELTLNLNSCAYINF